MPPELIPLAAAERYVGTHDDGADLRAALDELPADERDIIARIVSATGLVDYLEGMETAVASAGVSIAVDLDDLGKHADLGLEGASKQAGQPSSCLPFDIGDRDYVGLGTDTEKLVELLQTQREVSLSNATQNRVRGDMVAVFSMLLAIPSSGASAVLGTGLLGAQLYDDFRRGMYPSDIPPELFTFEVEPVLNEDHQTLANQPEWSQAQIYARSEGWNLSSSTLDIVLHFASVPGTKWIGKKALPDSRHTEDFRDAFTGELDNLAKEGINAARSGLPEARCYRLSGRTWGPFDVTAEAYTESRVIGSSIVRRDHRRFDLVDLGTSEIELELNEAKFLQGIKQRYPVKVLEKQISMTPQPAKVASPGEHIVLDVSVNHADYADADFVDFRVAPASASIVRETQLAPGLFEIEVETPTEEENFPVYLFAESLSKTLPEGTGNRQGQGQIDVGATLTIISAASCLSKGETASLSAVVEPESDSEVLWFETAGSLPSSGRQVTYQAPSFSTMVTVRAQLASDPDVEDDITFRVGECSRIAVYHAHTGGVGFPGSSICSGGGPDYDEGRQDQTVDGFEPVPAPPGPGARSAGDRHRQNWSMGGLHSRQFAQLGPDECITADFTSTVDFTAEYGIDRDGREVDVDFAMSAVSQCRMVGQRGEVCSTASAGAALIATYYLDVRESVSYDLVVELDCSGEAPPFPIGLGQVLVTAGRFIDGASSPEQITLPNGLTSDPDLFINPQLVSQACDDENSTIRVRKRLDLVGPLGDGDKDLVTLTVQLQQSTFGNLGSSVGGGLGIERTRHSMRGFFALHPVN